MATARELLSKWEAYCEKNWISVNHADTFCGENKVKRFFGGLTYFLLLGHEGVVTNYKEIMNGKREIPISSCPSHIGDMFYGTGSVLHSAEEEQAVKDILAEPILKPKGKKKKMSDREAKLNRIR